MLDKVEPLENIRLIKDHMVDFHVTLKLLNPSQHGFIRARSCLTNMLCFLYRRVILSTYIFRKLSTKCYIKDYY